MNRITVLVEYFSLFMWRTA